VRSIAVICGLLASYSAASADALDWRGAYVGGFGGAAWTNNSVSTVLTGAWNGNIVPLNATDRDAVLPNVNRDVNGVGATGGVTAGYNWLLDGFLLGIEADASAIDGRQTAISYVSSAIGSRYRVETSSNIDWMATVRGRLGMTLAQSLLYVTGGVAFGERSYSQEIEQLNLPFRQAAGFSRTATGWVVGGGVEQALSEAWSLRLQYLHVDFGSQSIGSAGVCVGFAGCEIYTGSHEAGLTLDTVSAGINYHF
jgi:outer membrane immunogenic protein